MLSIRESIEQIEEKSLKEAREKQVLHSVFSLKKKVSTLYRLLTDEKEFMHDMNERIITRIRVDECARDSDICEHAKLMVDDAIGIIDREIDHMDSYDRALDSVLTLQDLASIHRVESSINFLTIILGLVQSS